MRFFSLKLNIIKGKLLGSRAKNTEIQTNSMNSRTRATQRTALGRYLLPQTVQVYGPHLGVRTHDDDSKPCYQFKEGVLLTWMRILSMSLLECQL